MSTRDIKGKRYKLVVLRVTDWDEQGRPSKATIGYDDTTFDISGDDQSREFMTCFVPEEMTKTSTRSN